MQHIHLAPLQGYTDYAFRNAFHKEIGGVEAYYTPYLRFQNDGTIKNSHWKEVNLTNNQVPKLIPQILTNNSKDFLHLISQLSDLGYQKFNWNLGCPYPMVTKQKLGSGLLMHPDKIKQILDDVIPKLNAPLSIKTRLGYESEDELLNLIPILNSYPLENIIIHARIGKQLYKGSVNIDSFIQCAKQINNPVIYNGDICTTNDMLNLKQKLPHITQIMLGRGILYNPFLALELKGIQLSTEEKRIKFMNFHEQLFHHYESTLSGPSHQMNKNISLWEYFSSMFLNEKKIYKQIKKIQSLKIFINATEKIIANEDFK